MHITRCNASLTAKVRLYSGNFPEPVIAVPDAEVDIFDDDYNPSIPED